MNIKQNKSYSDIKIMVADDANLTLDLINKYLRDIGCSNMLNALNGVDAVQLYKAKHPDLVLLDIFMPVKNGLKALNDILEFDADAYVVIVSGDSTLDRTQDALKAGAKGFLPKPYNRAKIQEVLEQYLSTINRPPE